MAKRKSKQPALEFTMKISDHVLLGGTRASYPGEWYLGGILWIGAESIVVTRSTQNGDNWIELVSKLEVRAVGTIADLVKIRDEAREGVKALSKVVSECESALMQSRAALFAKLDELAEGGLKVIPPNFDKIDAENAKVTATYDAADTEQRVLL